MQGREEEMSKLYEILDEERQEGKLENRYLESVRRRLAREYMQPPTPITSKSFLKPKINIIKREEKKFEKIEEEERTEEEISEDEDLFEIERVEISEEKTEEKKLIPKEVFIDKISNIKGIGRKRAERLYESGLNSFEKILESDAKEISKKVRGLSEKKVEELKREISNIIPKMEEEFDQVYLLKESKKEKERVEKEISKTDVEFKEELPEWVTIDKLPVDEEPEKWKEMEEEAYRYEDYTLYKVEKKGKIKYVFSKKPLKNGEPCKIPKGYIVRINRKGVPSLEKVK